MTTKTAENPLITVEGFKLKKQSIVSTFSDTAKIDKAIEKFKEEALSVIQDLSTKKGRDAIASMAFKVSKKKTSIVSQMIDPSIEDAKTLVKSVNSGKKHFQTEMDKLRDEVREPLNKWEAEEKLKEEKRIADIQERILGISNIVVFNQSVPPSKDEITSLIEAVDAIDCSEGFAEFTQDAIQAQNKAKESLAEALNDLIKKELQEKAEEEMRKKETELEEQRLRNLAQERLNKLMMIPISLIGKSSKDIKDKINSLSNYEVPEVEFGDLYELAKDSVANVISQLKVMQQQQKLVEDAQPKQEPILDLSDSGTVSAITSDKEPNQSTSAKPEVNIDNSKPYIESTEDGVETPVEARLASRFRDINISQDEPEKTIHEKMNVLMYALTKSCARTSFDEFLSDLELTGEDYEKIKSYMAEKLGGMKTYL